MITWHDLALADTEPDYQVRQALRAGVLEKVRGKPSWHDLAAALMIDDRQERRRYLGDRVYSLINVDNPRWEDLALVQGLDDPELEKQFKLLMKARPLPKNPDYLDYMLAVESGEKYRALVIKEMIMGVENGSN